MKGVGGKLLGDAAHFTFEERIFNFVMLLGICMTVFGTIMDIHYKTPIYIDLGFVACWIVTYYLSRFKGLFNVISVVSMALFVFAFIPYNWIASGGAGGILPNYAIVFIAIVSIVLKRYFRVAMVLSIVIVELLLIWHDAYKSGSIKIILQTDLNLLDLAIHSCAILGAMAILIIIYSNTYMKEKARSESYARTVEEQYRQQLYYMENLEQLIYKLKSERHDFNNHLGVIYGLLESGESDKAENYAKQLVKTAEEYQSLVTIPYSMIRAMLNYKLSAAGEWGIRLHLDVRLPDRLMLNELDLTVILGNLLDNAIEACERIEADQRYITFNLIYKPDYLIIHIENPVAQEQVIAEERRLTTKPDAENHGFGLVNIDYLVKKHDGLMKIREDRGIYEVDIALLIGTGEDLPAQ